MTADVCVVGGGYTGLSAALHLAQAGLRRGAAGGATASAGAPRGATAARSARASGRTRTGWRRPRGKGRARGALGPRPKRPRRWSAALIARHAIACDLRPGIVYAAHKPGYVAEYHAYAEKLARDYGYDRDRRRSDRAGIAGAARAPRPTMAGCSTADAAHLHPLNYRARAGARGRGGGRADLRDAAGSTGRDGARGRDRDAARCRRATCSSPATAISATWSRRSRRG